MPSNFILREWKLTDIPSLTENADNINVWNSVRDYFPHPYTQTDAEQFIHSVISKTKPTTDFAIEIDGKAVGGIGVVPKTDVERITVEIGCWLGEKYWNMGIMSNAVKQMSAYVFENFSVVKIYATVFEFNTASKRVLEKTGFTLEAILKKSAIKNGKIIDLYYYSLIRQYIVK